MRRVSEGDLGKGQMLRLKAKSADKGSMVSVVREQASREVRRRERESGQALVEFALIVPLFLVIVVGAIQFGVALNFWLDMQRLANQGARSAAVNCGSGSNQCGPTTLELYLGQKTALTPEGQVVSSGNSPTVEVCYVPPSPMPSGWAPDAGDAVRVQLNERYRLQAIVGLAKVDLRRRRRCGSSSAPLRRSCRSARIRRTGCSPRIRAARGARYEAPRPPRRARRDGRALRGRPHGPADDDRRRVGRRQLVDAPQASADEGGRGGVRGRQQLELPVRTDADVRIVAEARKYAGPHRGPANQDFTTGTTYNPQIGGTPGDDIHVVLNGADWWDDDASLDPADATTPAGSICEAKLLDVKATEENNLPLFGLIPFFPDIKRRARVEIQEAQGLSGLLPIGVRIPKPAAAAAVFYDESRRARSSTSSTSARSRTASPVFPRVLVAGPLWTPESHRIRCAIRGPISQSESRPESSIATNVRGACGMGTPARGQPCLEDSGWVGQPVNNFCRQGDGTDYSAGTRRRWLDAERPGRRAVHSRLRQCRDRHRARRSSEPSTSIRRRPPAASGRTSARSRVSVSRGSP